MDERGSTTSAELERLPTNAVPGESSRALTVIPYVPAVAYVWPPLTVKLLPEPLTVPAKLPEPSPQLMSAVKSETGLPVAPLWGVFLTVATVPLKGLPAVAETATPLRASESLSPTVAVAEGEG